MSKIKTAELVLAAAEKALAQAGKPLHYAELAKLMVDTNLWAPTGKTQPGYTVYAYIHQDTQKQGEASKFRFVGRGVFALAGQAIPERPASGKRAARVKAEPAVPRTCGNCLFLTYTGISELTHESGACDNDVKSGRPYCRSTEEGCPFWRARSTAKRAADNNRATVLAAVVQGVNACAQRGVTWVSVEKLTQKGGR